MTHEPRLARAARPERRVAGLALVGCLLGLVACNQHAQSQAPALSADASGTAVTADDARTGDASSFGSYLAGRFARNERDLGSAADFLVRALADDPDNHDLRYQAFGAMLTAGRIDEVLPLAQDIVAVDPSAPMPGLVLGLAAFAEGDTGLARERLSELTSSGYNALLVPIVEAWLTFAEDDLPAAQAILDSVPDGGGFQAFRAFHGGLMNELAGSLDAAEASYRVAADAQPGAFRVAQALGGLYERMGRTDDARAVYRAFAETNEETPWLDDAEARLAAGSAPPGPLVDDAVGGVAEALFGLANALEGDDDHDGALALARLADHLRPGNDAVALLLGEVFEAQGRTTEAIESYRAVDASSPLSWTARLRIAIDLDDLDRTEEAIAGLEAMAAERPDRSDPWITMGDLRRGHERWDEAVQAYDQAVALIGEPEAHHWRLYYVRGITLERAKQWPRAEADFLKALELEPDQPYVLNYLGYSWVDQGINLGRALEMIEGAVDQRPNDGFIVDSLGWAHYRLGDYTEAVRQLERAVELQPDDPTINDHLGDAFWRVGRHTEAAFQWRRALSLEPDADLAIALKAKLERGLAAATSANGDG